MNPIPNLSTNTNPNSNPILNSNPNPNPNPSTNTSPNTPTTHNNNALPHTSDNSPNSPRLSESLRRQLPELHSQFENSDAYKNLMAKREQLDKKEAQEINNLFKDLKENERGTEKHQELLKKQEQIRAKYGKAFLDNNDDIEQARMDFLKSRLNEKDYKDFYTVRYGQENYNKFSSGSRIPRFAEQGKERKEAYENMVRKATGGKK